MSTSNAFSWSIPPYQTPQGTLWETQCWGPPSQVLDSCNFATGDKSTCWGTFQSRFCNLVDPYPAKVPCTMREAYQPGIATAMITPMSEALQEKSPAYSIEGVSEYARSLRAPLMVNRCWQNKLTSLGDGVLFGAQYPDNM